MMTIEERADKSLSSARVMYAYNFDELTYTTAFKNGAEEQRQIDIDKVCDLMISMLNEGTIETTDIGKVNTIIKEALKQ